MPTTLLQEILQAWRQAVRLLDELPPLTQDHELIRDSVATLQDVYGALSRGIAESSVDEELVGVSRSALSEATKRLDEVRARLKVAPPPSPR